jgi:hypothetical protein
MTKDGFASTWRGSVRVAAGRVETHPKKKLLQPMK